MHVHVLPCPDTYRAENLDGAAAARAAIAAAEAAGGRMAAFFSESILSCGGQVGAYVLRATSTHVQREVTGVRAVFGRSGSALPLPPVVLLSPL